MPSLDQVGRVAIQTCLQLPLHSPVYNVFLYMCNNVYLTLAGGLSRAISVLEKAHTKKCYSWSCLTAGEARRAALARLKEDYETLYKYSGKV